MSASNITRAVRRRTRGTLADYGPDRRQIVVAIEPGDVLSFRLLGTRRTYLLSIDTAMRYAIRLKVEADRAAKRAGRKSRA